MEKPPNKTNPGVWPPQPDLTGIDTGDEAEKIKVAGRRWFCTGVFLPPVAFVLLGLLANPWWTLDDRDPLYFPIRIILVGVAYIVIPITCCFLFNRRKGFTPAFMVGVVASLSFLIFFIPILSKSRDI